MNLTERVFHIKMLSDRKKKISDRIKKNSNFLGEATISRRHLNAVLLP